MQIIIFVNKNAYILHKTGQNNRRQKQFSQCAKIHLDYVAPVCPLLPKK